VTGTSGRFFFHVSVLSGEASRSAQVSKRRKLPFAHELV